MEPGADDALGAEALALGDVERLIASAPLPAAAAAPGSDPDPATEDYIALAARLYASPAVQAFGERRLALEHRHGAAARTSLDRGSYAIARDAYASLSAALDRLRGNPTSETLALALTTIETAGALLLALYDATCAAQAAAPAPDPEHGEGNIG